MRVCILCEESKVAQIREKEKNQNILTTEVSANGKLPATHRFCVIAKPDGTEEAFVNRIVAKGMVAELLDPKQFLDKWNLQIIR